MFIIPRQRRIVSRSGIYHVVIRGLDRQCIFEQREDYLKYLDILSFYKSQCQFSLFAYCLMSNHVHIILKINETSLDTIFRKINTLYAGWFNMKYQRTGHLQQERFYSEPIEDETYLLTAIRYVHQNPFNAGLEKLPGKSYRWNSIHDYLNSNDSLTDISYVYSIMSKQSFLEFTSANSSEKCLDIDKTKKRLPDDVARDIIYNISNCSSSTAFQKLPLLKRNEYLSQIHKEGVSIRQMRRLTGISIGVIQRALKDG